jgi:class 3 adenylate cyclase
MLGLYLRNVGANLVGQATVMVLGLFTPLEYFQFQKAFLFDQGGWLLVPPFILFVIFLGSWTQFLLQRPVVAQLARLPDPPRREAVIREKAKRRLLNLPFLLAVVNLVLWILIPALLSLLMLTTHVFGEITTRTALLIFFRAIMIGMIASTLSFFLVEDYSRRELIHLFFPEGKLSSFPGTMKLPILRRIRALYMAGTSVPMIILVATLTFSLWESRDPAMLSYEFAKQILIFTLVLCIIFVVIALRLNFLVGRSISDPVKDMLRVVSRVRDGDFTQTIQVVSNDELGVLCDAGNDMIAGLVERERIRDTFGKYVTPQVRDQILSGRIPLDGERKEATLLFSDLRDFTHYVENNDPEEVIWSMRAYFTAMEQAIRQNEGLVLQYVGDEIEAVFGVPIFHPDHAEKALISAMAMRKGLNAFNADRIRMGKSPFHHGIGIHTGEVLAGNTGSENRLSYALIGETVNLASRTQDLTKKFQCDILVTEATMRSLKARFDLEKLPPEMVRGYSKPITVYRLVQS